MCLLDHPGPPGCQIGEPLRIDVLEFCLAEIKDIQMSNVNPEQFRAKTSEVGD